MDKEECTELKNIQYQTMLLSGNKMKESDYENMTNDRIDSFLQKEKEMNLHESWNKLDRTLKNKRLQQYSEKYIEAEDTDDMTVEQLYSFLKGCLDKKRLLNNKEVEYCKTEQEILNIPALRYKNNRFGLERCEKRVSTLKSLTPIKSGTLMNNKYKI